ncbi:hypothetical protein L1987_55503 [Smallanthus sonchifolius]|uniref:Uncharacterized protein n=1 Tax=Smallanthus sonchifolius TaxID=185202 RepID=A0ACB9EB61_9ASTR|nr:hypothetical protein L1987_55503 [Smallanthus sonchifolius]
MCRIRSSVTRGKMYGSGLNLSPGRGQQATPRKVLLGSRTTSVAGTQSEISSGAVMGYANADPMLAAPYRPPSPRSKFLLSTLGMLSGVLGSTRFGFSSAEALHEALKRWEDVLENKGDRVREVVVGTVDKLREAVVFNLVGVLRRLRRPSYIEISESGDVCLP